VENGLTTRRNLYYAHLGTGRVALFLQKFFTGKGSTIKKLGTEGVGISSCKFNARLFIPVTRSRVMLP